MTKESFTIRKATLNEMSFFLTLAEKEGWNPSLQDAAPFYATDPNGFFIGEWNGDKVGCISAVAYNNDFGFIGFYIVKPEYRHKGFGYQLWQTAMQYLGQRTIGLDGVVAEQENYKKSGFTLAYRNIRFEGNVVGLLPISCRDLHTISFPIIQSYDTSVFGCERTAFLEKWIAMPNAFGLAILEHGTSMQGYGLIRECKKGWKIGPLFADNAEIATALFEGLCSKVAESISIDIPEINVDAIALAQQFGLKKSFETARMYTSQPPKQRLEKVFGVTTFELG